MHLCKFSTHHHKWSSFLLVSEIWLKPDIRYLQKWKLLASVSARHLLSTILVCMATFTNTPVSKMRVEIKMFEELKLWLQVVTCCVVTYYCTNKTFRRGTPARIVAISSC